MKDALTVGIKWGCAGGLIVDAVVFLSNLCIIHSGPEPLACALPALPFVFPVDFILLSAKLNPDALPLGILLISVLLMWFVIFFAAGVVRRLFGHKLPFSIVVASGLVAIIETVAIYVLSSLFFDLQLPPIFLWAGPIIAFAIIMIVAYLRSPTSEIPTNAARTE